MIKNGAEQAAQAQKQPVPMPTTYEALRHDLIASGRAYDFDMIDRAYQLASAAHATQFRRSGEPYICHPISVAQLLVELGMDSESVAAALMHDVAEDTPVTIDEIRQKFGSEVALLVDGVTKLTQIKFSNVEDRKAENLRKMLLAMSQDVRVMIIKLCDRLHNMRTGDAWPEQKRRDKALETMEVYAPIAHRLGISNIKEELEDGERYQTVYSKVLGSAAAPTAGLHFTERVLQALDAHGIDREELTLHVGAGTFKPVKSEEIEGHEMHTEYISVSRNTLEKLIVHGGKAVAVGTTSVRTLESLYHIGVTLLNNPEATEEDLHVHQWQPYEMSAKVTATSAVEALQAIVAYLDRHSMETLHTSTQIIIAPGYEYKIVKAMVTNFHQPQSTLLLLVSAFVHGDWQKIYNYALAHDFRFLSYGDSSLLIP